MSQLTKWLVKVFFFVMSGAFVAYEAMRSLNFIQATLSADDQLLGYLALFGTTVGGLVWLGVFLHESKGVPQKGIAVAMTLIDTLGGIALFMFDTFLTSGENGLTVALEASEIRQTIFGMSALIGLNILALIWFHIAEPDNLAALDQHFTDWKIEQAILKAKREKADSIADEIAEREADAYAIAQKAKDRSDKALPENTAREIVSAIGSLFSKPSQSEGLPLAAADTVGLPKLQPTEAQKQAARELAQAHMYIPGDGRSPKDASQPAARVLSDNAVHLLPAGGDSSVTLCGVQFAENFTSLVQEATCPACQTVQKPANEKQYLCKWCGTTQPKSMVIFEDGKQKCGYTMCGGFVEEATPNAGATFQDIPQSQNGGIDGGYTHNLSA